MCRLPAIEVGIHIQRSKKSKIRGGMHTLRVRATQPLVVIDVSNPAAPVEVQQCYSLWWRVQLTGEWTLRLRYVLWLR